MSRTAAPPTAGRPAAGADTRPLRVGIVGSGFIAGFHSGAYRDAGEAGAPAPFVLQRVASRNAATAAALARRHGWASATSDWREVTRADDVDLVAVCTPEQAHREVADDAFAHGKHVFCEKPLALTAADAHAMRAAADRAGTIQFAGFVLRFWPALELARRLLDDGELGTLKNVRARYLLDSQTVLESSLRGLGSHMLDALQVLAGPIEAVAALTRPTTGEPALDGRAAALLEFRDGATGVLEVDREARGRPMGFALEVDGEAGGLAIEWSTRDVVTVHARGGDRRQIVLGPRTSPSLAIGVDGLGFALRDLFVVQAARLAAAVAGETTDYADFADACHVADATDAILAAASSRAWERVAPSPAL